MKYCNKCRASVDSPVEHCPLCYATLSDIGGGLEPQSYPDLQEKARKYHLVFRILLVLSLAAGSICLTVNLLTEHQRLWSLIVISNIVYMWIAIGTALRARSRPGFVILVQALSFSALVVVVGWLADYKSLALNYLLPFCFATATLSITIIIVVKRMNVQEFVLYFILTALLGFIPVILMAFGLVDVLWPSLASAIHAGLSLVGIFVFADRATKSELRKRFHN